jgi:hypothetical protein
MQPSSLTQIVLFMVLLVPGVAPVAVRERRWPERTLSTSRELIRLIYVSLAADAVVLLGFATLRWLAPDATPNVGALVRSPAEYMQAHLAEILWWGGGLLVLATALAAAAVSDPVRRWAAGLPLVARLRPSEPHPSTVSAWWLAFNEHPGLQVLVDCALEDGSYVRGSLLAFTQTDHDGPDRDLVLTAAPGLPLRSRRPGMTELEDLDGIGVLVVSARRIVALLVTYVPSSVIAAAAASPSPPPAG